MHIVDALTAFREIFSRELHDLEGQMIFATAEPTEVLVKSLNNEKGDSRLNERLWRSRKQEFLDICEVELTTLSTGTG